MSSIIGIGIDIVEISRFSTIFKKNKSFKSRIFSKSEIKFCDNKVNKFSSYAKRFAAKEAFSKALGSGFRNGLNFNDISIIKNKHGKPQIKLNNKLKLLIKNKFKDIVFFLRIPRKFYQNQFSNLFLRPTHIFWLMRYQELFLVYHLDTIYQILYLILNQVCL